MLSNSKNSEIDFTERLKGNGNYEQHLLMMTPTINQTKTINQSKKTGFLTDNQGKLSSMRLMSWVALFAAIIFGWVTLTQKDNQSTGINITFGFLIAAFAPKAVQKFAEVNSSSLP